MLACFLSFISATLVLCYLSNPSFSWSPLGFVWTPLKTFPPLIPLSLSHPHPPTFHPLFYSSWGLVSQQVFLLALNSPDSLPDVLHLEVWQRQWWWQQSTVTEHHWVEPLQPMVTLLHLRPSPFPEIVHLTTGCSDGVPSISLRKSGSHTKS